MNIYAEIKNNTPTGVHKSFASQPTTGSWLPVIYGSRNPSHNKVTQKVVANRTITEDGTSVLYEEVVEDLPLLQVKANKLKSLQGEYDQLLDQGFQIPESDIVLALGKDDRNAFGQFFTLLQASVSQGLIQSTDQVTIADKYKMPHIKTVEEVFTISLQYGLYYQTQWTKIANANKLIDVAQTIEDVLLVTLA